jgi:hypothetical protein
LCVLRILSPLPSSPGPSPDCSALCVAGAAAPWVSTGPVSTGLTDYDVVCQAGMAILLIGALFNLLSAPWVLCGKQVAPWLSIAALLTAVVGTAVAGSGTKDSIAVAESVGEIQKALGMSGTFGAGPGRGVAIAGVIFTFISTVFAFLQRKSAGGGGESNVLKSSSRV